VLFSAAIAVVFTRGTLFQGLRERGPQLWRELAACPLCSGTWVGMLSAAAVLGVGDFPSAFRALGAGAAAGCTALAFDLAWDALESVMQLCDEVVRQIRGLTELCRAVVNQINQSPAVDPVPSAPPSPGAGPAGGV
jgi:hypothetical protein